MATLAEVGRLVDVAATIGAAARALIFCATGVASSVAAAGLTVGPLAVEVPVSAVPNFASLRLGGACFVPAPAVPVVGSLRLSLPVCMLPVASSINVASLRRGIAAVPVVSSLKPAALFQSAPPSLAAVSLSARIGAAYLDRVGATIDLPARAQSVAAVPVAARLSIQRPLLALPSSGLAPIGILPAGLLTCDGSMASLQAYHAAGRVNGIYIGYGLAGLAAVMGEALDIVPMVRSLIGGRVLLSDDGRVRLFASRKAMEGWLRQARSDVALMVGAHVMLDQASRDAVMADVVEAAKERHIGLARAAARERDADKRAALAAEVEFMMGLAA